MDKVKIQPQVYIWTAVLLFLLPLKWMLAAVLAAIIHESAHLLALRLLKCKVTEIQIGVLGAAIRTGPLANWEELVCALAGPVGSFGVILLYRVFPEAALCAFVQGVFNLLPVYPLDGGRAVRSLICMVSKNPETVCKWYDSVVLIILTVLSAVFSIVCKLSILVPVFFLLVAGKALLIKIPCKRDDLALQ